MTTSPVMSITDELVAELEALASKATPGPWEWDGREVDEEGYVYIPECSYLVGAICLADNYEGYHDDCDFMAAANPSVIRALLAERAELNKDRQRLDYLESAYGGHTGHDGGFHVSLYLPDKDSLREMVDAAMQSESQEGVA